MVPAGGAKGAKGRKSRNPSGPTLGKHVSGSFLDKSAEAAERAQRRAKRDAFEATINQKDWSNDPFAFFNTMSQSSSSLE